MKTLLFILLPFLSFAQYGEGRTGRFTEHQLHGIGGFLIASVYYEVTRPKNSMNKTPDEYQKIEFKQGLKTLFVVGSAAGLIETTDLLKGGDFSMQDFGATVTAGFASVLLHCVGRNILQDRRDWRRKGMRLRLAKKEVQLTSDQIKEIYYYKGVK